MTITPQPRSYVGESIYVGIDVHKRTCSGVVRGQQTSADALSHQGGGNDELTNRIHRMVPLEDDVGDHPIA
jgi:hypothetical protein